MFAGLLAEIRAYGEGLIIAEQIPAKLIPDVIKNTAVKIVHRLPARDDREAVGATMNLSPAQSPYLVTLRPGRGRRARRRDGPPAPGPHARRHGPRSQPARRQQVPGQVITARSVTCGAGLRGRPVHAAADARGAARGRPDPRITLWAELPCWPT